MSIINIGQTWYSFGWESQLLEIGFLSLFLLPLYNPDKISFPTPLLCIWGNRWLLFRIMIGAGMIKIRGDKCWKDLTCMNYHYLTQPVPNPLSILYHNNNEIIHQFETLANHFVELLCPWLLLIPFRSIQTIGGIIQILFQFILISSGNLSFLNWLTALPAIMCFDDQSLLWLCTNSEKNVMNNLEIIYQNKIYENSQQSLSIKLDSDSTSANNTEESNSIHSKISFLKYYTNYNWTCIPVINNILSPSQHMNINFEPFRIVNSYGAFGSITKIRHEVIIQGTHDEHTTPHSQWKDFEFACKPGDINRRPCMISPYHYRVDWLLWFAAFQNYQYCPWIVHLSDKLLRGDSTVNRLLAKGGNPFYETVHNNNNQLFSNDFNVTVIGSPPKFIRAELYEYQYAPIQSFFISKNKTNEEINHYIRNGWEVGKWWRRKHVQSYMPAIQVNNPSVKEFLQAHRLIN
eukprot:gene14960-20125_t